MCENEEKNKIELKTIEELLGYNFTIPSYQRGYRWKSQQVEDLLDDIQNFANKENKKNDEFYCLQPVVVKAKAGNLKGQLNFPDNKATIKEGSVKIELNDENQIKEFNYDKTLKAFIEHDSFEVIDGQQRLTTVYLILKFLENKNLFSIDYDTRDATTTFLENINNGKVEDAKDLTIDQYHIKEAWKTIKCWFDKNNDKKELWKKTLLKETQVIWYEPEGLNNDSDSESIKIFQRLNIGKIPLTNSELIRALFILKTKDLPPEELNAYKIASEWDFIEQQLHNNDFWGFITLNNPFKKDYPNRIEFIFDLIEGGNEKDHEDKYSTFRMYENKIKGKESIKSLWQEVKNYYYRFNEWYINDELYHLIGYVRLFDLKECSLKELLAEAAEKKESELKSFLKVKINNNEKLINQIETIEYENKTKNKIRQILVLHNIATYEKLKARFPFYRYVKQKWDIEHIHARGDKIAEDEQEDFIKDWLKYFKDNKKFKELEEISKSYNDKSNDKQEIFNKFLEKCNEIEPIENSLSNLALLDEKTNRAYKNDPFPTKRTKIIKEELKGKTFIPLCTKNIFLKCYSSEIDNMKLWGPNDRKDYIKNLTETLKDYLNIGNKEEK